MLNQIVLVAIVLLAIEQAWADMDMSKDHAMTFLKTYHYMGENHPDPAMHGDEMYGDALKVYQRVAGLKQTGELDEDTMKKMTARRCGMPDIMNKGDMMKKRRRRKRYALYGSRWYQGKVTYSYKSYPSLGGLEREKVEQVVGRAMKTWSEAATLHFTRMDARSPSDIEISFVTGDHGDGKPLDGAGPTLAHAFYPNNQPIGGDMHFDDEETWTVDSDSGIDLYYTALHELGHSLGLSHSMDRKAVMFSEYPGYSKDIALTEDDINGIRVIYGGSRGLPGPRDPPAPEPLTNEMRREFCSKGTVDAAGTLDEMLFFFQGDMYVELDGGGIRSGYPRYIKDDWPGLPDDLDAAMTWEKHKLILFFKGKQYWRYSLKDGKRDLTEGYPRRISEDFKEGLPDEVDAAFVWSDNGDGYVIKGSDYYRLQSVHKPGSDRLQFHGVKGFETYPGDFELTWHVKFPGGLSEAVGYRDRTFFFGDQQYVRYNDNTYQPQQGYPVSINEHWLGCKGSQNMEMHEMEKDTYFAEINSVNGAIVIIQSVIMVTISGLLTLYLCM